MASQMVHVFGYGRHGRLIAEGLIESGYLIHVLESDEQKIEDAKAHGHVNVDLVDMTDDDRLKELDIDSDDLIVCVMDDEHFNVFLTLSLRQMYPDIKIFAISDSIHTAEKLQMAGASKVIDLYQVSATHIHNYLKKPVTTHLLSGFIGDKHDISFREFVIPPGSFLHGRNTDDLDFGKFNLLLLGIIDLELGDDLIFITEGKNHKLDSGDVLVCIGKDVDLDRFEETIKKKTI